MSEIEQRARELLAAEYEAEGSTIAQHIREQRFSRLNPPEQRAIRALQKLIARPSPSPVTEGEVERVARAIAIADGKDPDAPAWVRFPGGYPEGICWRDQYQVQARAALSAIRSLSPTREEGI